MENKGLLTVIAVVLIGILSVMIVQMNQEPDTVGEQASEAFEEITDEIDDNTTAR